MYEIIDTRISKDFSKTAYNIIKKSDVKKKLLSELFNGRVEDSYYWCAELVCSGNFILLWEIIIEFVCKDIYIANPKLIHFIYQKYSTFKNIIIDTENIIELRNNNTIRHIFLEIVSICCFSNKESMIDLSKLSIPKFDIHTFSNYLTADNIKYIEPFFFDDDPKELYLFLNEIIFNISNKNIILTLQWLLWIIEYSAIRKKNKDPIICHKRFDFDLGNNTVNLHPIWIIWDIIFKLSSKSTYNIYTDNIIDSLFNLYKFQLNESKIKSRIYIVIFAVKILFLNDIHFNIPVLDNKEVNIENIKTYKCNIDRVYKKIDDFFKLSIKNDPEILSFISENNIKEKTPTVKIKNKKSNKKIIILENFLNK